MIFIHIRFSYNLLLFHTPVVLTKKLMHFVFNTVSLCTEEIYIIGLYDEELFRPISNHHELVKLYIVNVFYDVEVI